MITRYFIIALSFFVLLEACSRNMPAAPPPPPPTGTTPPVKPADSTTKNTDSTAPVYIPGGWQCTVDGVPYSGTIDTSWFTFTPFSGDPHGDTTLNCIGSSSDKRAHLSFVVIFNRYSTRNVPYFWGAVEFDTCSENILEASNLGSSTVKLYIDSSNKTTFFGRFDGTAVVTNDGGSIHTITNGKFYAGLRGGNHEPNSFRYTANPALVGTADGVTSGLVSGYFNEARLISNTLVLNGTPGSSNQSIFRLMVRTGGTIKPGVYRSDNGDAGILLYYPSINRTYVDDSTGSLTITISDVSGNIVHGSFSGTNQDGSPISAGSFAVRVKDYVPEADAVDKWGFGTFRVGYPDKVYRTFGGNILNGALTTNSGRYYLTVNGESDFGASVFKIVLSSVTPITKGTYSSGIIFSPPVSNRVDSLYFISPEKIWNGFHTDYSGGSNSKPALVIIDSIDAHQVKGELKGFFNMNTGFGGTDGSYFQLGRFSASF